jgi:hypothetical protein
MSTTPALNKTESYFILVEMLMGCCLHSYDDFLFNVPFEM